MNAGRLGILQLRSSAGLYGADRMALTLNQALNQPTFANDGIHSRLLSINNYRMTRQSLHDAATRQGQPAMLLPCRGRLDHRTLGALATAITVSQAQVLHAHDYKSAFYAWLASRTRPVALVATLHGQVETSRSLRFYHRLELALLHRFDALVVVADRQAESLRHAGIAVERIRQIDNAIPLPTGIPAASPAVRRELGLTDTDFVFGAVARMSPEKNLSMLLDGFASIADNGRTKLLIAGDGPERGMLEARIEQLGIGTHVRLLGERRDMQRVYPAFDCLVLPSLSEGMPLVVLEAMAHGLPVIASRVGDVPRLLSHADHGHLLPAGDAAALRDALRTVSEAPRLRDRRASDYVFASHSPEAMAARYLDVYQSLLAHHDVRQSA